MTNCQNFHFNAITILIIYSIPKHNQNGTEGILMALNAFIIYTFFRIFAHDNNKVNGTIYI